MKKVLSIVLVALLLVTLAACVTRREHTDIENGPARGDIVVPTPTPTVAPTEVPTPAPTAVPQVQLNYDYNIVSGEFDSNIISYTAPAGHVAAVKNGILTFNKTKALTAYALQLVVLELQYADFTAETTANDIEAQMTERYANNGKTFEIESIEELDGENGSHGVRALGKITDSRGKITYAVYYIGTDGTNAVIFDLAKPTESRYHADAQAIYDSFSTIVFK